VHQGLPAVPYPGRVRRPAFDSASLFGLAIGFTAVFALQVVAFDEEPARAALYAAIVGIGAALYVFMRNRASR
jgi:hypothetical protein